MTSTFLGNPSSTIAKELENQFMNKHGLKFVEADGSNPAHYEVIATGQKFNTLEDYIKQMQTPA